MLYVRQDLSICVFFLFVITTVSVEIQRPIPIREFLVDIGQNLSLPCPGQISPDVMWVREGREDEQAPRLSIADDGSLILMEVDTNDSGIYMCTPSNVVGDERSMRMRIYVRSPPPPPNNVKVLPSTILAVIMWNVNGTGGYPISYFTAQYRLADSEDEWLDITPIHIPHNARQIDVYKLLPNTTYAFRIWAANQLGNSDIAMVYSKTKISNEAEELERHFLQGIRNFDSRIWMIAVGIVMGTLTVLGLGTCFLFYQECRTPGEPQDQEIIELVPNIILNPGYDGSSENDRIPADENLNSETTRRLNNNTVVQPMNL